MQPERKVQGNTRLEFIADRYLQDEKKKSRKLKREIKHIIEILLLKNIFINTFC